MHLPSSVKKNKSCYGKMNCFHDMVDSCRPDIIEVLQLVNQIKIVKPQTKVQTSHKPKMWSDSIMPPSHPMSHNIPQAPSGKHAPPIKSQY